MWHAIKASIVREWLLVYRKRIDMLNPIMFFVIIVMMFPLAVSPDPDKLQPIATGVVWISALLAMLLSLDNLFRGDYDDGTLEQMLMSPFPQEVFVLVKIVVHWLVAGLPLVVLSPVLALALALDVQYVGMLFVSILFGTLAFSFLGAIGAALTVGLKKGGLLLSILIMPLTIPIFVFGSGVTIMDMNGLDFSAPLMYLAGICVISIFIGPFVTLMSLKISLSE